MKMKLRILLAGLGLIAAVSTASAYPLDDEYWGHNDHGSYDDVIGSDSKFNIFGAGASRSSNSLTVEIYTNFAGKAGNVGFRNFTRDGQGIGYGDLFLSPAWTPHGTGPHYEQDNAGNGTHWTYAFVLDNPLSNIGGSGTLYKLALAAVGNNNPSALLSDDFMSRPTFRNGQAVAADTTGLTSLGSGSWIVGTNFLSFTFDTSNLAGFDPNNFALHWAMYCANDVIEGLDPISVPAPNTISLTLLGLGLLGLAYVRPRRRTPLRG